MVVTPDSDWFSDPPNTVKLHILEWPFIVASLKVRSHQMWMKRYARMIYMLSQCKDAIDNPAALFAQMRRREWREWCEWRELRSRIVLSVCANRASWKIWSLADIRTTLTNQELAQAVTWLWAEAENPKQQWRTNLLWLYVGTRSCTILLRTFTKTNIDFATRLELPGRSPSHDANSHLLCSEFHARMKWVNSKCSSVQLRANSAIYSLHSCLVWTHLKAHLCNNHAV